MNFNYNIIYILKNIYAYYKFQLYKNKYKSSILSLKVFSVIKLYKIKELYSFMFVNNFFYKKSGIQSRLKKNHVIFN